MQLPGLLIEYLINGAFALLWMLILLVTPGVEIPAPQDSKLWPLFVPLLYVLGMLIDFVAALVVTPAKRRIKQKLGIGVSHDPTRLWVKHSDLAREISHRSSRDRIARGTIINSLLLTISLVNFYLRNNNHFSAIVALTVGFAATVLSFSMWHRFQSLSLRFEKKALKALRHPTI